MTEAAAPGFDWPILSPGEVGVFDMIGRELATLQQAIAASAAMMETITRLGAQIYARAGNMAPVALAVPPSGTLPGWNFDLPSAGLDQTPRAGRASAGFTVSAPTVVHRMAATEDKPALSYGAPERRAPAAPAMPTSQPKARPSARPPRGAPSTPVITILPTTAVPYALPGSAAPTSSPPTPASGSAASTASFGDAAGAIAAASASTSGPAASADVAFAAPWPVRPLYVRPLRPLYASAMAPAGSPYASDEAAQPAVAQMRVGLQAAVADHESAGTDPAAPGGEWPRPPERSDRQETFSETRQGMLVVDGAQLGRWMIDHLERRASRPGVGTTGIDPRISATFPGAPTGA